MKFLLFLTLPLYALDQLTKWLVVQHIEPGYENSVVVIPGFFNLVYLTNTGAAFSSFSEHNIYFVVLSVCVLIALAYFYKRGAFKGKFLRVGFALLLAGILGNLTDRIIHHQVIDFLLFDLHVKFANPFAAFNVADSCICVAAAIFITASFRAENKTSPSR